MQKESKQYYIIVNLEFVESVGRYIPEPYIVKYERDGSYGSLKAKATPETIVSYNLIPAIDDILKIIEYCSSLSLAALEGKYCTRKRTENTLIKLFQTPLLKNSILGYFDRVSNQLFTFLERVDIPLVIDIERKTRLEQLKVNPKNQLLSPILRFEKTQLGVKYSLQLQNEKTTWSPNKKDVHILTNENAWIIADYQLYKIENINGNKLKPFLKKDHIFIKNEMVITYFEKFIIEVARKSDIEAIGFDMTQSDTIEQCRLGTTYDFINNELLIDVIFDYGNTSFAYGALAQNRTKLNITDDKKISINQIKRNREKEEKWVSKLSSLGLIKTASNRFKKKESSGLDLIHFLTKSKSDIHAAGIKIDIPSIEGKKISLSDHSIQLTSKSDNDWFDIFGVVTIAEHRIPFAQLLEYIRVNDRFYPLPDGTHFVIPETWMTKYEELAKFGENNKDKVRIKKSQYTFVSDIEEIEATFQKEIVHKSDIQYTASPNLNATLRPYQEEGVKWLITHKMNGLGACLADDMGLGKTLQTIAVLSHAKDSIKRNEKSSGGQMTLFAQEMLAEINPLRALIILPSSLVFNWYEEIRKFNSSLHTLRFVGTKRKEQKESIDKFDIVLTTYHTALKDKDLLKSIHWEYIILDESQMIKNKESKMFKAINELSAENRISLSGTPIENSLSDLWSQMEFINPGMLGNFAFFKKHYLTPIEKHRDIDTLSALSKMIKPYILRRTKEEVATDLPSLTEKIEYITLAKPQKDAYDKVKSATRNYLLGLDNADSSYKFHVFAALTKLRQISTDPKLVDSEYEQGSEKVDYIISQMDTVAKSGHKVLIFSSFTKIIKLFTAKCEENNWSYVTLTGADSQAKRKQSVDQFQTDQSIPFFFISLKAGGTGLNLTAADYVFILDPWWNPFAEKQAIARAHRIGQENPVTVIRYIAKDTIEEKIIKLQAKKTTLSDDIIHFDEDKIKLEESDLDFILS